MLRNVVPPSDAFHRAGIRHDHDVVLVGALRAQSFRREHPANDERHVFDPQDLTDRDPRCRKSAWRLFGR